MLLYQVMESRCETKGVCEREGEGEGEGGVRRVRLWHAVRECELVA